MPEQKTPVNPEAPAPVTQDVDAIRTAAAKEAVEAFKARSLEIETVGRELKLPYDFVKPLIADEKLTALDARQKMIVKAQELMKPAPQGAPDTVRMGEDETDKFRSIAETAMLVRSGYPTAQMDSKLVSDLDKTDFRSGSLLMLARKCLERSGVRGAAYMGNSDVARAILDSSRATTAQGSAEDPASEDPASVDAQPASVATALGGDRAWLTTSRQVLPLCGSSTVSKTTKPRERSLSRLGVSRLAHMRKQSTPE